MITKFFYSTCEGGNWREAVTDQVHLNRVVNFLMSLSTPLPTKFTVLTASMAGLQDNIVVHSCRTLDGWEWDAIGGVRPSKDRTSLNSAYDQVTRDDYDRG